jgi:tetrahydromethanopterin S-methyltransferase subunit C
MTHPILESRSRVLIWCLAWVILAAGQASVIHFVYGSTTDIAVADGIISMLLYGLLGIAIWFPVRYMLRSNNKVLSTIINVILTGAVTIILWLLITRILVRALVPEKEDYDLFWHTVLVFRVAAGRHSWRPRCARGS